MAWTSPPDKRRRGGTRLDDERLAHLACGGDRDAFWQLVERHHPAIYRLTTALLGAGAQAEDAAQEVFVRAYDSLGRYDPERPFGPWLRGIAVNVCRQYGHRGARHQARQVPLSEAEANPTGAEPRPGPGAALEALAELDEIYRVPLALFYVEDASVDEVAEALGLSPGAVRVRLHRGREKLRQILMERKLSGSDQ